MARLAARQGRGAVSGAGDRARRRLRVDGIVQGVGFRPFVHRLAAGLELGGFVTNTSDGVVIEIEGPPARLDEFARRLRDEAPPLARVVSVAAEELPPADDATFVIRPSVDSPGVTTLVPPDVATCADCLREIRDPRDRRFRYPFTNCTNCGPRWTIIRHLPYDRPWTSMAGFTMCPRCRAEYDDPADRRFHAQPNACPECGPRLRLATADGIDAPEGDDPLDAVAALLTGGRIVAIKGLGGFHLALRADDQAAVRRLRERKRREGKPLALMVPDLATARRLAEVDEAAARLLSSPQAPIVLLPRRPDAPVADAVAPGHRRLGIMLPYTPLHHLLLDTLRDRGVTVLVMTSGNASDEPICLDDAEAQRRLAGIADGWLLHDRPIVRRADDSVVLPLSSGPLLLRRSRGYAPVPVFVRGAASAGPPVLATGAELKNTVCLLKEDRAFVSPHVGDLSNLPAYEFFRETIATLEELLECRPAVVACDLHPGYLATRWAREAAADRSVPLVPVQHHHAHLAAVQAEHGVTGPTLGLVLDGTGYGDDGTIWGGELLLGDADGYARLGHLETVPLPGGDAAIRAPWRIAVAYMWQAFDGELPDLPWLAERPAEPVLEMLRKGVNTTPTSSAGRLFDAVAALTGRWGEIRYEAQAAIELTALTDTAAVAAAAPWEWEIAERDGRLVMAVAPLVRAAAAHLLAGGDVADLAARFHATVLAMWTEAARLAARQTGVETIVLAGGVMQNEILATLLPARLREAGLDPLLPRELPPNDGAISVGQAVIARRRGAAA
jgi:[NiFe] hydrogenase maturation protein HypF